MYQTTSHRGRYRIFAKAASTIAAVTGVIAIIGWIVGIPAFKSLMPGSDYTGGYSTIKFNSAVCILLAGISLRLLCEEPRTAAALRISNIASAIVMLVGSLTLIEYIGGLDFGIDQLFFIEPDTPPGQFPGRMAAAAALIFITISGTLLLLGKDAKARWVEGLTFLAFFNTLVPAIGYVYGKNALYRIPYYGTISLPLTLIFLLLCATILALRPERGLMRLVTDGSSGSITARHLLPAAILLPIAIGRLEFWGYTTGMYDAAVGMIAMTLSSIVIFTLLIGGNAHLLLRLDNRRTEAEETLLQSLDVLESNMNALMQTNARLQAEISIRRATEENLFEAHEKARVTLNSIGDGVITTDIEGKVTYLNPAAERMSGWSSGEAMGQPIAEVFRIVDPVSRHPVDTALEATLHGNRITHIPSSSLLIRRDGTEAVVDDSCAPMHDRNGQVIGAVLAFHDVSAVRAMSLKMSYITQHDSLTDLPNRFLLNDRLRQAVVLAQRHGTRIALLFLDLDRFKHVNDTLSHAIGDRVLTEIAQRLKRCTHDTDTVSRHSGDEFIILLLEVADSIGIARMAAQVLKSITEPYFIDSHEIHISASIGISICPEDGEDADTLIRHAEAAMYQAKSQGRNNYQF
ncbi:MAG TPA: diguanylate cyclase, partial [Noviherbaspirillum sp.]